MNAKQATTLSYSAGQHGRSRVRVYEHAPGGVIFAAVRAPDGLLRVSLGHRDRKRAKDYADYQAVQIAKGISTLIAQQATLAVIIGAFLEQKLPDRKTDAQRKRDRQRAELWLNYLGGDFDPARFRPAD